MSRWIIAVGYVTMVVGIAGAAYGVWTIWRQHHLITSARPVMATVLGHETKDLKASGFVAKVPLVKYEYTVDQKRYTSDTVTPTQLMLPNTWADSVFRQFPIGAQAPAQYDPNDPGKAFLVAKYAFEPYLPLLASLVIAALGLGVVCEQLTHQDSPRMASTNSGAFALGARQHPLSRARVLGIVGIIGLVCGAPAIVHHLSVSTPPHERMAFLMEGAYGIAVLTALARSALQFRQAGGFGTPVATIDRSPTLGLRHQLDLLIPTRFTGTASLMVRLKCEAKDTKLFHLSEENPDTVLLEETVLLLPPEPVSRDGEITRTADLTFPHHLPPSTPADSAERFHVVWSLIVTAEGSGGRKAETEYILSVAPAAAP